MEVKQDEPAAKPRRYDVEELKYLKDSPYVVKPPGLPPADQWMGPPADTTRNSTKSGADRTKNHDSNVLLDQTPRRPGTERHISRNSANPEDIILGPPKTSFLSATPFRHSGKNFDSPDRAPLREADSRDRFNLRTKTEGEGDRTREGRNNLRPKRAEGDQDSDGWSTVKPRKSFGTEGAERFNGRMGLDRHRDDRRFKDREDRETKERPRGFDTFSRDNKDSDHDQETRKNGAGRGRNEPSWFREKDTSDAPPTPRDRNSNGDRFADRSRGWREKDRDERTERGDRGDRRWDRDRDQRQEREPEWMDEPVDEKNDKNKAHSLEEFQKWKEQMSGKDKPGKPVIEEPTAKPDAPSFFGLEKKVLTPMEIDSGPDKFFGKWSTPKDEVPPELGPEMKKENIVKAKATGKSSRFTSFFNQEDAQRRQSEPPAIPPPAHSSVETGQGPPQQDEKQAFAALLQKLHFGTQGSSGTTPPANPTIQPKPPAAEKAQNNGPIAELFQQYRPERQEEARQAPRNSQTLQDLQIQRQLAGSQPIGRPNSTEQLLQDLVGQRQNTVSQSSSRPGQSQRRDTQADFLMGLMKSAPEPQRSEQVMLGIPPKQNDRQLQQQLMDRDQEMQRAAAAQRERSASQRQTRPQAPPGFYDDPAFQRGPLPHDRQPQPTQILTRPPPPGLDLGWDRQAQLPPQHRIPQNIAPPPGLANGLGRMPMPQQMFPPFPMGAFPPPDVMAGPRNMQMQPPPGFYNAPPPGFMPPGMSGFQGPEGMAFGAPFDGRGPPPQGAFRRQ